MSDPDLVVCSFYTDDDYYRTAAESLTRDLDRLGVPHVVEVVQRTPGEEWPDICRRKIPFVARVCAEYPRSRVMWVDVDCSIRSLPLSVRQFSADFIGFQRGFGSPFAIGYSRRTRFWEPCFFGVNATPEGRALIAEAATLERTRSVRATDDYFLEEAWRALAPSLSFQVIPSVRAARDGIDDPEAFFVFGSSGQVPHFKGKVEQHRPVHGARRRAFSARRSARSLAKKLEAALPERAARRLRTLADRSGATGRLVNTTVSADPKRQAVVETMLRAARAGDESGVSAAAATLRGTGRMSPAEQASLDAARAFVHYAAPSSDDEPLALTWWSAPYPGNFGDWLSPLVTRGYTERPIRFQPPAGLATARHLVGIGSIGRFIKPNSVVVGTGIASPDTALSRKAHYVSLRGPLTAAQLRAQGGPSVESFGDPGLLVSRVIRRERGTTNGRIALVRHTTHRRAPVDLPEGMDELSVLMSHPDDIERFLTSLLQYDAVVTSAMHVMIACHSYGIPCALVTFEGLEDSVPGSGMKYADYALGAGIVDLDGPVPVPVDLRGVDLGGLIRHDVVSAAKLDEIEHAVRSGIDALTPVSRG